MTNEHLGRLNSMAGKSMQSTLGIRVTGVDGNCILGEMAVDERTTQPFGVLHGGASAAFAETLASYGANMQVDFPKEHCVGVELNCSYLHSVRTGETVYGRAKPIKIGKRLQVWQVDITNAESRVVTRARVTLMKVTR